MAFLDKIGEIAKNVGDKTGDLIETGKLNVKISAEKKAISEAEQKIGAYYYKKFADGETLPEDVTSFCRTIQNCLKNIEDLNKEIENIKEEND